MEKEEIQEIVNNLGEQIDHTDVKKGLQELADRKTEETTDWGDSRGEYNGWQAMGNTLASDGKKPKRRRKKTRRRLI